ncbi:MAG: TetR/AcrR family transcriptional regulator [Actinomycetota bacterium]|nr:TetR/AcrR family transcriptional regulator [Actinomycetota bacterium]
MVPTTTRTRAKRGEGEKLRDEIIVAAEKLLGEVGSKDAVSIRAIADACNVTPPAIYMHFADKDQLFLEVCSIRFRELDVWVEEAGAKSTDPLESLRLRGAAYVRFGVEHPETYRLLMMTAHDGHIDDPGMEAGRDAFMHMVEAVDRGIRAGALGDVEPYKTSLVLWSGIHGLTSLFISFPNFEWGVQEELVEHMLDVLIEGLLSV